MKPLEESMTYPEETKTSTTQEVLYVHPTNHMIFDEIIPFSLPALIQRLPVPVLGLFPDELSESLLAASRVVLLDLHWYTGLRSAMKLARKIKAVNPDAMVVAGGLTASIFARQLLRHSSIDYIIRGDAEQPLPLLIEALLSGQEISNVPNIVGRNVETAWSYTLSQEEFNTSSYTSIDFFPSLKRRSINIHRRMRGHPVPVFPWLVPFRGCPLSCGNCSGSPQLQQRLFRRDGLIRAPSALARELEVLSRAPEWQFVNCIGDWVSTMPLSYTREVLKCTHDLNVYYEFFQLPFDKNLDLLLGAFRGGQITIPIDTFHATSAKLHQVDDLIRTIRRIQKANYLVRLDFVSSMARRDRVYRDTVMAVHEQTGVRLYDAGFWWEAFPLPNADGDGDDASFDSFLHWKKEMRYTLFNTATRSAYLLSTWGGKGSFMFLKKLNDWVLRQRMKPLINLSKY